MKLTESNTEAFLYWLGLTCGNKGIRLNGNKMELMWYIISDADGLWDGIESSELPLYTTNQIIEKYFDLYGNI